MVRQQEFHFLLITLILTHMQQLVLPATFSGTVRQAPFCIDEDEVDLRNFKPIFTRHNNKPRRFIAVSPDTYSSPTGFIKNVTFSRISIRGLEEMHPYRIFQNYFHITISAHQMSDGMQGLFVQPISAPLGVPFGEFVTDFDCGDCSKPSSSLPSDTAKVPCKYRPAASYLHPQVLVIGGKLPSPTPFHEAHFNFRYVDYPCFDVIYAQFLIIAVRTFKPLLQYDIFYTPMYKVNIEGVGAPYPFYYGWKSSDVQCHHPINSEMTKDNWAAQRNQKVKVKYSKEYEKCYIEDNRNALLGPGNICPPGPVTCAYNSKDVLPPKSLAQWVAFRSSYNVKLNPTGGIEVFCFDCGKWEDIIGQTSWPEPPVVTDQEDIDEDEDAVTKPPFTSSGWSCEARNEFGKNITGGRDRSKDRGCDIDFEERLAFIGWRWGKTVLKIHGVFMIFSWTVASNCLIYCARFLKEASNIEKDKGTGCFSIGHWIWGHMILVYIAIMFMWTSLFMFAMLTDLAPVCNVYDAKEDTEFCSVYSRLHRFSGGLAVVVFHMGLITGWTRPETPTLRFFMIAYHAACGYIGKYLGLLSLLTTPYSSRNSAVKLLVIMLEISFWLVFLLGTCVQRIIDSQMGIRRRKIFPVPETIDTFIEPPLYITRKILFPLLCVFQCGIFGGLCWETWEQ